MIKLYDFPLSGHGHRARLMLSLIGVQYENILVDLTKGEQKKPPLADINPFGQIPVLVDDDVVIRDSNAIITYLARKYSADWYPSDPVSTARIQEWLATSTKEIAAGPGAARLVTVFGAQLNHKELVEQSHALLSRMDSHLENQNWLALDRPTVADVSAYSYIAHAPEGGVALDNYPNVRAWLQAIEALPGFVAMPKAEIKHVA